MVLAWEVTVRIMVPRVVSYLVCNAWSAARSGDAFKLLRTPSGRRHGRPRVQAQDVPDPAPEAEKQDLPEHDETEPPGCFASLDKNESFFDSINVDLWRDRLWREG